MTLTIDLPPEVEARLRAVAEREGVEPAACAERVLAEHLPSLQREDGTPALFARWRAEDGADDPEEIAAATREWEEFKHELESHPLSLRTPDL